MNFKSRGAEGYIGGNYESIGVYNRCRIDSLSSVREIQEKYSCNQWYDNNLGGLRDRKFYEMYSRRVYKSRK